MNSKYDRNLKLSLIKFLFPLYPIKITNSVHFITILGLFLAARLILSYFALPILPFGVYLSISWIPVYIVGFIFGPIVGLVFGAASDTIAFILNGGGLWMWIYAIQEPLIGMISGFFGSVYFLAKLKNIKIQIIVQKIIVYGFICFTIFMIVYQYYLIDIEFHHDGILNIGTFVIVSIVCSFLYLLINEIHFIYLYKKSKRVNNYSNLSLYLFISTLVIISISIFSFILGPFSAAEYIKLLTGKYPSGYISYGAMYYLLPRLLKESIKTPITILAIIGIITAIKTNVIQMINISRNRW